MQSDISLGLYLHFLNDYWCWASLQVLLVICISPLKNSLCQVLWCCCCWCWTARVFFFFFNVFWILAPYQIYDLQIFSLFHKLPFHYANCALSCIKVLKFWWSPVYLFFLLVLLILVSAKKSLPNAVLLSGSPVFSNSFGFRPVIHIELFFVYGVR